MSYNPLCSPLRFSSGGGNKINNELNRADIPVLWMGNEALRAGLRMKPSRVDWEWKELQSRQFSDSLRSVWRIFEYLPFKRLSYDDSTKVTTYESLSHLIT